MCNELLNFGSVAIYTSMRLNCIFFLFLFLASHSFAQQEVNFKGNKFVMSAQNTVKLIDPVTGVEITQTIPPRPVTVNGKKIYSADTVKELPVIKSPAGDKKISIYLFDELKTKLDKLEDGNYILSIHNVVVDSKGSLIYYEFDGIKKLITKTVFISGQTDETRKKLDAVMSNIARDTSLSKAQENLPFGSDTAKAYSRVETQETDLGIDPLQKEAINAATKQLLETMPKMLPAALNHVKVNCTGSIFSSWNYIIVKDHAAVFSPFYDSL